MMKKVELLVFCIIYCVIFTISTNVNAKQYSLEEIPDDAYIIGTHMFSSSLSPETSPFYSGLIDSSTVMLGSTTIDTSEFESSKDFVIYYKFIDDIWFDSITGDDITPPEEGFSITHINGECVDASCMGNAIQVKFLSTAGLENVFETKTINVGYGEMISASEIPELKNRPGFKFVCWTLEDSDECFDLSTAITDELVNDEEIVVLETKWEQISYKITYNNNFDDSTVERQCTYNNVGNEKIDCSFELYDSIFAPRNNYTFIGWSTTPDGKDVYDVESDMGVILGSDENVTLYAIWDTIDYKITYDLDGGTFTDVISPQVSFDAEDVSISLPVVSKVGYEFKEWTYNDESFTGLDLPNNDITLKAVWEPINYSFVYNDQRVDCTYDKECSITLTDNNVPEGKKFIRWYIMDDLQKIYVGDDVSNFTTEDGREFTLYPEYELVKYFVSYDLDGGTLRDSNFSSFTFDALSVDGNQTFHLNSPAKVGYEFNGWEVVGDSIQVNSNTEVEIVGAGDAVLKAKWLEKEYTIEYYNEDSLIDSKTCNFTNCLVASVDTEKENFVFDGWKSEQTGLVYSEGNKVSNTEFIGNTVKLVAKWTNEYRYTIAYDLNGGIFDGDAAVSYVSGEAVTLPTPNKEGYTFAGWQVDGEDIEGNIISNYNKDIEVTAKWTANKYNIHFNMGEVVIPDVVCTYDVECKFGDHSSYIEGNYKLLGWSLNEDGSIYYGDNLNVKNLTSNNDETINLYAVLEDTTIYRHVSYYLDGGSLSEQSIDNSYADGTVLSLPVPVKEGYDFTGWYDVNSKTIIEDDSVIKSDLMLVAQWKIKTYTISYVNEEGEALLDLDSSYIKEFAYGTKELIVPGGNKLPEGISGWKFNDIELDKYILNGDETSSYILSITENQNITIVGIKTPDAIEPVEPEVTYYEVSFYDDDSLLGIVLVVENETITSENTVPKEGSSYSEYLSQNWTDLNGDDFDIESSLITENINLYLKK